MSLAEDKQNPSATLIVLLKMPLTCTVCKEKGKKVTCALVILPTNSDQLTDSCWHAEYNALAVDVSIIHYPSVIYNMQTGKPFEMLTFTYEHEGKKYSPFIKFVRHAEPAHGYKLILPKVRDVPWEFNCHRTGVHSSIIHCCGNCRHAIYTEVDPGGRFVVGHLTQGQVNLYKRMILPSRSRFFADGMAVSSKVMTKKSFTSSDHIERSLLELRQDTTDNKTKANAVKKLIKQMSFLDLFQGGFTKSLEWEVLKTDATGKTGGRFHAVLPFVSGVRNTNNPTSDATINRVKVKEITDRLTKMVQDRIMNLVAGNEKYSHLARRNSVYGNTRATLNGLDSLPRCSIKSISLLARSSNCTQCQIPHIDGINVGTFSLSIPLTDDYCIAAIPGSHNLTYSAFEDLRRTTLPSMPTSCFVPVLFRPCDCLVISQNLIHCGVQVKHNCTQRDVNIIESLGIEDAIRRKIGTQDVRNLEIRELTLFASVELFAKATGHPTFHKDCIPSIIRDPESGDKDVSIEEVIRSFRMRNGHHPPVAVPRKEDSLAVGYYCNFDLEGHSRHYVDNMLSGLPYDKLSVSEMSHTLPTNKRRNYQPRRTERKCSEKWGKYVFGGLELDSLLRLYKYQITTTILDSGEKGGCNILSIRSLLRTTLRERYNPYVINLAIRDGLSEGCFTEIGGRYFLEKEYLREVKDKRIEWDDKAYDWKEVDPICTFPCSTPGVKFRRKPILELVSKARPDLKRAKKRKHATDSVMQETEIHVSIKSDQHGDIGMLQRDREARNGHESNDSTDSMLGGTEQHRLYQVVNFVQKLLSSHRPPFEELLNTISNQFGYDLNKTEEFIIRGIHELC